MSETVVVCLSYGSRNYHACFATGYAVRVLEKLAKATDQAIELSSEVHVTFNHKKVQAVYDVMKQMDKKSAEWVASVSRRVKAA